MSNADTQPSIAESPVQAEVAIKADLWASLVENRKSAWVVAVALFYLSGFLALNANLAKFGIGEFEFISARYALSAGNFAFFLLCYLMLALMPVLSIHAWIKQTVQSVVGQSGHMAAWGPIIFARSISMPLFMHCCAATLYSATALSDPQVNGFSVCLVAVFALTYAIESLGLSKKYPKATEVVDLILEALAVSYFFSMSQGALKGIFWTYVGLSVYVNFALDMMSRRKRGLHMYVFFAANTAISVLTLSIVFGSKFYDQISPKLGGGMPYAVTLSLDEEVLDGMPTIAPKKGEMLHARLIYQTDKYLYLSVGEQAVRVQNDKVKLLAVPVPAPPTPASTPHSPQDDGSATVAVKAEGKAATSIANTSK